MKKAALLEKKLQLEAKILEARKAQFNSLAIPSLKVDDAERTAKIVEAFNAKFGTKYTLDAVSNKVFNMDNDQFSTFANLRTVLENRSVSAEVVEYNDEPLSRLIESEVEKAQVVIAAQAVIAKLQKVAEDIVKIQTEQVMPMIDHIKMQFGRDIATDFDEVAKTNLDAAFEAVRAAKDTIGDKVEGLNAVVNGEEYPTDLASDSVDEPEVQDDFGLEDDDQEADDDLSLDFDELDIGRETRD